MITKLNFTDRTIKSYAIRKLTPKECFRLMGVRDNVIGTMQSSNAQASERLPDWKTRYLTFHPPLPTRTRRRYSSPRSPVTTRSSWLPMYYAIGIPTSDGHA